MRVNIKLSVERNVEEDLCIYSYGERKSYDVLSGRYSGLSRLFPEDGEYIVKVDFDSDQFRSDLISAVFKKSEEHSYERTKLIGKDTFTAYHPETLKGTYVLESGLSGFRCIIDSSNPIYRLIPYIRSGSSRRISITTRQDYKWIDRGTSGCSSGKQTFMSWREAKIASRDTCLRENMKAVYKCSICGCWHLTTKDGKILKQKDIYNRKKEKKELKKTKDDLSTVWKDDGNPNRYWRVKLIGLKKEGKK